MLVVLRLSVGAVVLIAVVCALAQAGGGAIRRAEPLSVRHVRLTTPFRLRVSGTYIRVSGRGARIAAVNAALGRALLSDQRLVVELGQQKVRPGLLPTYHLFSRTARLVSASTVVVSALIPLAAPPPLGTDGSGWFSVTVRVQNGQRVGLRAILRPLRPALRAISQEAKRKLPRTDFCVRRSLAYPPDHKFLLLGFAPTVSNYREFALVPAGLAIGFWNDQVAAPACGRSAVVIPYAVVRPYLTRLGAELVAGVRAPG